MPSLGRHGYLAPLRTIAYASAAERRGTETRVGSGSSLLAGSVIQLMTRAKNETSEAAVMIVSTVLTSLRDP